MASSDAVVCLALIPCSLPYMPNEAFSPVFGRTLLRRGRGSGSAATTDCGRLLREFIDDYCHMDPPHQGLDGEAPIPRERGPTINGVTKLVAIPAFGGLLRRYERVAA